MPPSSFATMGAGEAKTDQTVDSGTATEIAKIRDEVDCTLKAFLLAKNRMLSHTQLSPLVRRLAEFVDAGGKRLRPTLCAVRPVLDSMRTELMLGQYLDLFAHCNQVSDVSATLTTTRYKTAKYTVERPLQVGACLAGATTEVLDACTQFALPLGEAFQLRDDLLGVFGDPAITGKSRFDDLRDGKSTTLLALAKQSAGTDDLATLHRLIGDPELNEEGARIVRRILTDTGAVATIETMISERRCQALAMLDNAPFHPEATASLRHLAYAATVRAS